MQGGGGAYLHESDWIPASMKNNKSGELLIHSDNLGVAAHEMGHMKNDQAVKNIAGKNAQNLWGLSSAIGGHLGGALSLPSIAASTALSPDSRYGDVASVVPATLMAPRLIDEASATARGLKSIANTKGIGSALKNAPGLLGALGTYGTAAGAPILTRYLRGGYNNNSKQRGKNVKN